MTYSKSPKSHSRTLKKIHLPNEIKTFFSQRRKFIKGLPSYEQIEGTSPENHDHCFDFNYGHPIPIQETHPVNNRETSAYELSQKKAKDLLHLFFHAPRNNIAEPFREYMLTGGTKPIRISTHIEKDGRRVYVKLPSVERIIGLSLYNLISDKPPINFLFSEYVFIEDSVQGRHIDKDHIQYFQRLHKLPESLVRLTIQDKFLGINDLDRTVDLPERKNLLVNLLVQSNGDIVAFDVDCAFTKQEIEYDLVQTARDNGLLISKDLEKRISKEEAKKIIHTITAVKNKSYENFIRLMDKIDSLKKQFNNLGFKCAREYFSDRENWLKNIANLN